MSKLLLIGSLANKKNSSKTGGTLVLFEILLQELRAQNIDFDVIDSLKDNYPSSSLAFVLVVFQLLRSSLVKPYNLKT